MGFTIHDIDGNPAKVTLSSASTIELLALDEDDVVIQNFTQDQAIELRDALDTLIGEIR